jgi:hypothetical protein
VIEQAKGVLRERFGWSVQDAFELLRYAARSARVSIHSIAADVLALEETPPAVTIALARSARWRAAHQREHAEAQRARAEQLTLRVGAQQERLALDQSDAARRLHARGAEWSGEMRRATNEVLFREVNERIHHLIEKTGGQLDENEFVCECGWLDCAATIRMPIEDYERVRKAPQRFVVALGHDRKGPYRVVGVGASYFVVEKEEADEVAASE